MAPKQARARSRSPQRPPAPPLLTLSMREINCLELALAEIIDSDAGDINVKITIKYGSPYHGNGLDAFVNAKQIIFPNIGMTCFRRDDWGVGLCAQKSLFEVITSINAASSPAGDPLRWLQGRKGIGTIGKSLLQSSPAHVRKGCYRCNRHLGL